MSISPGFSTEQIREFVHRYEIQPYGQKAFRLEEQGVSYDRLRRWRSAVFDGDLDRGLIPREGGVVTPPEKRRASSGNAPVNAPRRRRRSPG